MSSSVLRSLARPLSRRAAAACSRPTPVRALSRWGSVPQGPADPILGVTQAFNADPAANKLNLGVGAYRDDNGDPVVVKSVREATRRVFEAGLDNEYAPIGGDPAYVRASVELAYGDLDVVREGRVVALQSLSGTGSLRVMGQFIKRFGEAPMYLPNPTWGNHIPIFQDSGLEVRKYRYYDPATKGLDYDGLLEDVRAAPDGSAFLFHACAHNPTGVDPTLEQWRAISDAVKAKNHFVLFDSAYQGFASGDPSADSAAVHLFIREGHQVALSQSFAKNFGLYGHRVGTLSVVVDSPEEATRVESQLKIVARATYSSPPIAGARIVRTVWEDPELRTQWYADVKEMAERIISMRTQLKANLEGLGSSLDWSHMTKQIGMFCFSGMDAAQVERLAKEHHVYLTSNGRISMVGVTSKNVQYLAEAIHDVTK